MVIIIYLWSLIVRREASSESVSCLESRGIQMNQIPIPLSIGHFASLLRYNITHYRH